MRRFSFSLKTVLKVKRSREEQVQREFSTVLEKRSRALAQLGAFENTLNELNAWSASGRSKAGALDRFMVGQFEASRAACSERIQWQRAALLEIESELEAKRLELVEASREVKVIEKLEESQYQAYLEKLNREEQAFMDELAQFGSRNSAGAAPQTPQL